MRMYVMCWFVLFHVGVYVSDGCYMVFILVQYWYMCICCDIMCILHMGCVAHTHINIYAYMCVSLLYAVSALDFR